MAWTEPIFDRTQADVDNKEDKAYADYDFYIRVEENSEYLADKATELGYPLSYTTKFDWVNDDIQIRTNTERIIDNMELIRSTIPTISGEDLPSDMRFMDYVDANDIEELQNSAYNVLTSIENNILYSTISSGSDRVRQYLQRG